MGHQKNKREDWKGESKYSPEIPDRSRDIYNNNRLFMAPHLIRAQSAYKDIRVHSFHHTHMHTHAHTCTHMHTHTHAHTHTHMYTHTCTHTHTHTHTHMHYW